MNGAEMPGIPVAQCCMKEWLEHNEWRNVNTCMDFAWRNDQSLFQPFVGGFFFLVLDGCWEGNKEDEVELWAFKTRHEWSLLSRKGEGNTCMAGANSPYSGIGSKLLLQFCAWHLLHHLCLWHLENDVLLRDILVMIRCKWNVLLGRKEWTNRKNRAIGEIRRMEELKI